MTVKELIILLEQQDEDLEVVYESYSESINMSITGVLFSEKNSDRNYPVVKICE